MRPSARGGRHKVFNESHERVTVRTDVAVEIHELQNEIDPFCGCIGLSGRHDIALTHDWHTAFDHKAATRISVPNNGAANHNAFMRFEFDFEGH